MAASCYCGSPQETASLKVDILSGWLGSEWIPAHPDDSLRILVTERSIVDQSVITKFDGSLALPDDYRFESCEQAESPVVFRTSELDHDGQIAHRTGAFTYRFTKGKETISVLALAAYYSDQASDWYTVCVAAVPEIFLKVWQAFANECNRLKYALEPTERVIIIGGRAHSFVPTVNWEDIILPGKLKSDILEDVSAFFSKGIAVYKRLNLKPFRKLLLAGVPGTGKTMLCSALAKWAISQNYLVIYVSSAARWQGDAYGSAFSKIQHALSVASSSAQPTLILLEELDAYLHPEEKALVLNVLDGNESSINDQGTLLVATTNYPEAIDERVLKRPGRLDRVFIIPEMRGEMDAEAMLRQYLGAMWKDEHRALVPKLVGYPGAFIREVAVYALTQVAYDDLSELSYSLLARSFDGLKDQLDARDDFLKQRSNGMDARLMLETMQN